MKTNYLTNCVCWPANEVDALHDLIDSSIEITRKTFISHVDTKEFKELQKELGYSRDFYMKDDWHVKYFKSTLKWQPAYGFTHSCIEYIFQ